MIREALKTRNNRLQYHAKDSSSLQVAGSIDSFSFSDGNLLLEPSFIISLRNNSDICHATGCLSYKVSWNVRHILDDNHNAFHDALYTSATLASDLSRALENETFIQISADSRRVFDAISHRRLQAT